MIAKLSIGKSAGTILNYCLSSKQKSEPKKSRGKILFTQYCYGSKNQLIKQFENQCKINNRCIKPIWHTSLSFSELDLLDEPTKIQIAQEFASKLGFTQHQFVVIQHSDGQDHMHLIFNRIGLDGKHVVTTSHNYRKVCEISREIEIKYNLQKVLSPRAFLNGEQKKIPRKDKRKESIKNDIEIALRSCLSFEQFKTTLELQDYAIFKSRGISFMDAKKVKVKGSEIGFSLSKIEGIIKQNINSQRISNNNNRNLEICF